MSAESPRHARSGGPLIVQPQPPSDRSIIDAVSGFINDVTLSSSSSPDPKDTIQWARFETADINEPTAEGENSDVSPLLLVLGYGAGVQVWLISPNGEAQEVLSWRQGTVRVLRILPTPVSGDSFASKRPLIALCDSASPGPPFCSLSFISIRGGEQVKSIKFKNAILDVLANKRSVVVSFAERFAVFDAATLEDRMAVTTCYPCPCPLGGSTPINPLALGDRWLAYADKKLNPNKRSSGGCEGEGVSSYTATVLHAAKSLGKGLRGLGESVAQSLGGGGGGGGRGGSPPHPDLHHPGVVTIIDIEGPSEEESQEGSEGPEPVVAHFVAHSEPVTALRMDGSGLLLVTADRRGHDFHVFRINPHLCGPHLAAVHHLYVLHRGDTTAKVQDIAISADSRWAAVSTLRGTTHIYAISPYGGPCAVRTHTPPRVVNRLSRFHRSAGLPLPAHAAPSRSGSPVGDGITQGGWFPNPRLPPYPVPTTVSPLAQMRPTANIPTHTITRNSSGRQRLSSLSEETNSAPLLARARFGFPSSPLVGSPKAPAHCSLYLVAANGLLLQLLLHPRPTKNVPKEKICDDTPIELDVEAVTQWPLQRPPVAADLLAPVPSSNPLLQTPNGRRYADASVNEEERWLAHVEIVTHAGPHRRLWMGPQFVFKTYTTTGSSSSLSEAEAVEIETSVSAGIARSNPVNMPGVRPVLPVLIDDGSASSLEQSPSDGVRRKSLLAETGRTPSVSDVQLREDLAEAMKEDHGTAATRAERAGRGGVARAVDPLGTVVVPTSHPAPLYDELDVDRYTRSNTDEASFRPVVRAAAAFPPHPDLLVRPLPRGTRIPVQTVTGSTDLTEDEPLPLKSDVVIPARLTNVAVDRDAPRGVPRPVAEDLDPSASEGALDESLPKPDRSDDIQPTDRVKKSPTPKLVVDDNVKLKSKERLEVEDFSELPVVVETRISPEKDEVKPKTVKEVGSKKYLKEISIKQASPEKSIKHVILEKSVVDLKEANVSQEIKVAETITVGEVNASKHCKDINKKTIEVIKNDIEENIPNKKVDPVLDDQPKPVEIPKFKEEAKAKELKQCKEVQQSKEEPLSKEVKLPKESSQTKEVKQSKQENPTKIDKQIKQKTPEPIKETKEESSFALKIKMPSINKNITLNPPKSETIKPNSTDYDMKAEEQAWDLLLTESEQNRKVIVQQPLPAEKNSDETKSKSKRNRKNKKTLEESASKSEDDSFVEIHAIDHKSQESTGDLVSISSPYEDSEPSRQFYSKRMMRSTKSVTPERHAECVTDEKIQKSFDILPQERTASPVRKTKNIKSDDRTIDLRNTREPTPAYSTDLFKALEPLKSVSEISPSYFGKETKSKKSKSLSPFLDSNRKLPEKSRVELDDKDLIYIDSTKDDFPEIQITRGIKNRKKSPQPVEIKEAEVVIEKPPIKSWSTIAASKNGKKATEVAEKKEDNKIDVHEVPTSSRKISLQDKLFELCKRTDILVAECDEPAELIFVEGHMGEVSELPPLVQDFELNHFKLEAMKDSLLEDTKLIETPSPLCKINIDDILSSFKESTSRAIESSTYNLVDLEKVTKTKEKGFSVVENDKITTQEINIKMSDDKNEEKELDKSSDDDNTSPVVLTDSDKEDKKAAGASIFVQPSTKQSSAKAKKSRRKKK